MKKTLFSLACVLFSFLNHAQTTSPESSKTNVQRLYVFGGGAVSMARNTSLLGSSYGAHLWWNDRNGFALQVLRTDEKFLNYSVNFEDSPEHRTTRIEDASLLYLRGMQWRNTQVFAGAGISAGRYTYRGNKLAATTGNESSLLSKTLYDIQKLEYIGVPVCVGINTGSKWAGFQFQLYANLRSRMDAGFKASLMLGKIK